MTAPFRSSLMTVRPEWIDFNGHLNMAYYNVLFDQSVDESYGQLGFGPDYRSRTGCTTYVAEFHVCYLQELHAGDQVYCTFQLVDYDNRKFHCYLELFHEDGWLAATGEGLTLHVNQTGKPHVANMPAELLENFARMTADQSALPRPARLGRHIAIKR